MCFLKYWYEKIRSCLNSKYCWAILKTLRNNGQEDKEDVKKMQWIVFIIVTIDCISLISLFSLITEKEKTLLFLFQVIKNINSQNSREKSPVWTCGAMVILQSTPLHINSDKVNTLRRIQTSSRRKLQEMLIRTRFEHLKILIIV